MDRRVASGSGKREYVIVLALVGIAVSIIVPRLLRKPASTSPPATQPASQPATMPATAPASQTIATWMDVVRLHNPQLPPNPPLVMPLDLKDAACVIINNPVYLCPRGDLWITHPDAPPTPTALKAAAREQVHVTTEPVRFVHWAFTDAGTSYPVLIVPDGDRWLAVTATSRKPLPITHNVDFSRAFSWFDRIVAPADEGATIIDPVRLTESFQPLPPGDDPTTGAPATAPAGEGSPVRLLLDTRGVVAWRVGGPAARFVDDRWTPLGPPTGWSQQIIELLPLLDGSVIQLVRGDDGACELRSAILDAGAVVDEQTIHKLVTQLSDEQQELRDAASAELARYGPAAWPTLEKALPNLGAEAAMRVERLLSSKLQPKLGLLRPIDPADIRVAGHLPDGGALLFSDAGFEIPRGDALRVVSPAWAAIRPGRAIQLLSPQLVADLTPTRARFTCWGDEWIVSDSIRGPQRFLGNHLAPLLPESLKDFDRFRGIDGRGRWLFARPAGGDGATVVLDPYLPDPTPKLPVWTLTVEGGTVGWDDRGWPVQSRGGSWALLEDRWEPLQATATVHTMLPPPTDPPATQESESILLKSPTGTYLGGSEMLRLKRADGVTLDWALPPEAIGSAPPTLVRTNDGTLFLFNAPGRVLRIRETGLAGEPFKLEATFARDIPNADEPQRIWLDPAGRIVFAYNGNKLALLFPEGRIPPAIARMMPDE